MTTNQRRWRSLFVAGGALALLLAGYAAYPGGSGKATASPLDKLRAWHDGRKAGNVCDAPGFTDDIEGQWYWLRGPEEEKRVVTSLYNRYCIRCHGVDGRGVWDIPDVPDFTNARWQATRSDGQLARSILQGRGAVMPPFRGSLTLEESYAMARYLRTLVPGTEVSRPDVGKAGK
jgi:Cytochrome C oxidase, cbb3-type, subunit III